MKFRYTIEVLAYDGRSLHRTIEADAVFIQEGSMSFKMDAGDHLNLIAIYPANKTIVTKIEKIK